MFSILNRKTQFVQINELLPFNYKNRLVETMISLFTVRCYITFLSSNYLFTKNGFHAQEYNQQRRQFTQWNEILNVFVIGNSNNVSAIGNETLELQAISRYINAERSFNDENSTCQNQVIENIIDDKIQKRFDDAVMTIENQIHDAILTAMDNVVMPRVEMAVRSITGSSGQGSSSLAQNPDRADFTGNTENTRLMSASSRLDLIVDQNRDEETRNVETFEDGDFPALRLNYDRRALAHHKSSLS